VASFLLVPPADGGGDALDEGGGLLLLLLLFVAPPDAEANKEAAALVVVVLLVVTGRNMPESRSTFRDVRRAELDCCCCCCSSCAESDTTLASVLGTGMHVRTLAGWYDARLCGSFLLGRLGTRGDVSTTTDDDESNTPSLLLRRRRSRGRAPGLPTASSSGSPLMALALLMVSRSSVSELAAEPSDVKSCDWLKRLASLPLRSSAVSDAGEDDREPEVRTLCAADGIATGWVPLVAVVVEAATAAAVSPDDDGKSLTVVSSTTTTLLLLPPLDGVVVVVVVVLVVVLVVVVVVVLASNGDSVRLGDAFAKCAAEREPTRETTGENDSGSPLASEPELPLDGKLTIEREPRAVCCADAACSSELLVVLVVAVCWLPPSISSNSSSDTTASRVVAPAARLIGPISEALRCASRGAVVLSSVKWYSSLRSPSSKK